MHRNPWNQIRSFTGTLILTFLVLLTAHVKADTYNVASETKVVGPIGGASYDGVVYRRMYNYTTASFGGISTQASANVNSNAVNVDPTNHAGPQSYPYRQEYGYKSDASTFVCVVWFNAYNSTLNPGTTDNKSGTVSGGVYLDDTTGIPMDPVTGDNDDPDAYKKTEHLENNTTKPIKYNVAMHIDDGSPEGIDRNFEVNLAPGESTDLIMIEDYPFEYQISHSPDNPLLTIEGEPVDMIPIIDATGEGEAEYDDPPPGANGSISATPPETAPMAPQAAAGTATPSTGTGGVTNDNNNTNAANLGAKIDRGTAQALANGNQAHADANANGQKLDKLLNGKGTKPGDMSDGGEEVEVGAGGLAGITGKLSQLNGDLATLAGCLTAPGTGSPSWNLSIEAPDPVGTFVLNLDQFSSAYAIVRAMILLLLVFYALWSATKIVRGTFVDEA